MISHISKFFLIFIFIILFLSFKNQIKILENNLSNLKNNYFKDHQTYINKEILLSKQINQFQINKFHVRKLHEKRQEILELLYSDFIALSNSLIFSISSEEISNTIKSLIPSSISILFTL